MPFHQIITRAAEYQFLTSPKHKFKSYTPLYIKWQPPNQHHYQLNTDARSPGFNGIGGVIHSPEGDWLLGFAKHIEFGNSIQMELLALLHGLRIALQHGYLPLEINIDAEEVITLLQSDNPHYTNLLTDCRLLLKQLDDPLMQHVYREANMVADGLAYYGMQLASSDGLQVSVHHHLLSTIFSMQTEKGQYAGDLSTLAFLKTMLPQM